MKKISLIAFVLVLMSSVSAFAAAKKTQSYVRPYGMAGCGLGSMAFGRSGGQVFASSTNYTFGQPYAITTGTSNCVDGPNDEVASRMDRFVTVNELAVATDIARGDGETVASISHLMNCSENAGLGAVLQRNFREIFPSHEVKANEVTDSIISVVKSDAALSAQCKGII